VRFAKISLALKAARFPQEAAMENSSFRAEERTGLIPLILSITAGNYIQDVYDFLTRPTTVSEDEPIS